MTVTLGPSLPLALRDTDSRGQHNCKNLNSLRVMNRPCLADVKEIVRNCLPLCVLCVHMMTRNSSLSTGDITSEDVEDVSDAVQDAEIYLLKSGELT